MIASTLARIQSELQGRAKLVAVTKTRTIDEIMQVYQAGQRIMGENRVQELVSKQGQLPGDIEWHLIGHLQTNKVKYIAPFVSLVHSVDSLKLAKEIDNQAARNNRVIPVLLQAYVASEETKFGLDEQELFDLLRSGELQQLKHIRISGIMGMATNTDDMEQVRREFAQLKRIFDSVKQEFFAGDEAFSELSMGMSNDYLIAAEEGSTMVRVGSLIFNG